MNYRKNLIALAIIFTIGIACYFDSLNHPFMIDDHGFFDEKMKNINLVLSQFAPNQNQFLGVEDARVYLYYRPFAHIIPMINYWLFADNVMGHHAVNLFLFCLSAFMVYLLIFKLFDNWLLGVLTAAFYLAHPINGVVVNYITANVFAAEVIFMTLSLWFVIASLKDGRDSILSIIFFILALLCHESASALPLYAMALLIFGLGMSFKQALQKTWVLWLVLIVYFIFRWNHASLNESLLQKYGSFVMNPMEYLASLTKLAMWYLSKLVFPTGIVLIWTMPVVRTGVLWWFFLLIVLSACIVFLMNWLRREPVMRMGLAFLVIGFGPMALGSLFQPIHGLMVEPHWFIFSGIGFFLIMAHILSSVPRQTLRLSFVAIILIAWMSVTHIYNGLWANEERYCLYWLDENPGFSAVMFYLGQAFTDDKNYGQARYYYLQALKRHYAPWMCYVNLGNIDLTEGKTKEAEKFFKMASGQVPNSPVVLTNMGMMCFKQGDDPKAVEYFQRAIKIDPYFVAALYQLAKVYEAQHDTNLAEQTYLDARSILPHDEEALVPLLKIYFDRKDGRRVVELCKDIAQHSRKPESLTNCGELLGFYRSYPEAIDSFNKSIAIGPNYVDAYWQAGVLFIQLRQEDRALQVWQRGLKIAPNDQRLQQGVQQLSSSIN